MTISSTELLDDYRMDRAAFTLLVFTLNLDPAPSLLAIATWMWLRSKRFPNIITKAVSLPRGTFKDLFDEAVACFTSLESYVPPNALNGGMTTTGRVMRTEISLQIIYNQRFTAISGIRTMLSIVCSWVFTDILKYMFPNRPLRIPGFPHPVFGDFIPRQPSANRLHRACRLRQRFPMNSNAEIYRTLLLKFSEEYPVVTEKEVRKLFTLLHGHCVEAVFMDVDFLSADKDPESGRLILRDETYVNQIMEGKPIIKLKIHGKPFWARTYEGRM